MNSKHGFSITLRVIGLLALIGGIILTQNRAGDWFFRSNVFSESFASALLVLRILAGIGGLLLIVLGGKLGSTLARKWSATSPFGKASVITVCLALMGVVILIASLYFRENMIFLETITRYKSRFQLLGFSVVIQADEMRAADFITCIFFAMAAALSFFMYAMHQLGIMQPAGNLHSPVQNMWLLFSLGFWFLVFDEYFGVHEFIGDNLSFVDKFKITRHPDDMVIVVYFIVAMIILVRYRRYLLSFRPGLVMLGIGVFLHFLATVLDAYIDFYFVEEALEEVGIIFYFGAISQYALQEVLALKREDRHRQAKTV